MNLFLAGSFAAVQTTKAESRGLLISCRAGRSYGKTEAFASFEDERRKKYVKYNYSDAQSAGSDRTLFPGNHDRGITFYFRAAGNGA